MAQLKRPKWSYGGPRRPIGETVLFIAFFGLYGAILTLTVRGAEGPIRSGDILIGLVTFVILSSFVLIAQHLWRTNKGQRVCQYFFPSGVLLSYFLLSLLMLYRSKVVPPFQNLFTLVIFVEAIILVDIFIISTGTLLPQQEDLPNDYKHQVEYLKLDLTNWWRWVRLAISFYIAIGVGIAGSAILGQNLLGRLVIHTLASTIGIAYMTFYGMLKVSKTMSEISKCYNRLE